MVSNKPSGENLRKSARGKKTGDSASPLSVCNFWRENIYIQNGRKFKFPCHNHGRFKSVILRQTHSKLGSFFAKKMSFKLHGLKWKLELHSYTRIFTKMQVCLYFTRVGQLVFISWTDVALGTSAVKNKQSLYRLFYYLKLNTTEFDRGLQPSFRRRAFIRRFKPRILF